MFSFNADEITDAQIHQLYREWWKESYGNYPNSQATIIAAAWARHFLQQLVATDEQG